MSPTDIAMMEKALVKIDDPTCSKRRRVYEEEEETEEDEEEEEEDCEEENERAGTSKKKASRSKGRYKLCFILLVYGRVSVYQTF